MAHNRPQTPITGIADYCAGAVSGKLTAALPRNVMNRRRLIDHLVGGANLRGFRRARAVNPARCAWPLVLMGQALRKLTTQFEDENIGKMVHRGECDRRKWNVGSYPKSGY